MADFLFEFFKDILDDDIILLINSMNDNLSPEEVLEKLISEEGVVKDD